MRYEFIGWDTNHTIPYFEFEYKFKPPNPRYERIIVKRDKLGRIIRSEPPPISV